ncbi:MAG: hypothetical protein OXI87_05195 [Albidovulum sp.]|nr:hypothetical protein [Albidovulum sp.]MDE0531553.1 hypothetical protein [Albidovulum sp.]
MRHGSVNWQSKTGYSKPAAIDSITRHLDWPRVELRYQQVGGHLEPEPVMVPPTVTKSSLVEQQVLALTWSHAFATLETAR